ncbi:MAG: hypothetical protein KCHDKBKB_02526 [Elusimicrobia bacterium]|nr:hypothetical protein [Elusimicrobiota bacterium]
MKKIRLKKIFKAFAFATLFAACGLWVLHPNLHSHAHDKSHQTHCLLCEHIKSAPEPVAPVNTFSPSLVIERLMLIPQVGLGPIASLFSPNSPRAPPSSLA